MGVSFVIPCMGAIKVVLENNIQIDSWNQSGWSLSMHDHTQDTGDLAQVEIFFKKMF